jgi:hypothetical protein
VESGLDQNEYRQRPSSVSRGTSVNLERLVGASQQQEIDHEKPYSVPAESVQVVARPEPVWLLVETVDYDQAATHRTRQATGRDDMVGKVAMVPDQRKPVGVAPTIKLSFERSEVNWSALLALPNDGRNG